MKQLSRNITEHFTQHVTVENLSTDLCTCGKLYIPKTHRVNVGGCNGECYLFSGNNCFYEKRRKVHKLFIYTLIIT